MPVGQVLDVDLQLAGLPLYAVSGYFSTEELEEFARNMFDGGISRWGKDYLFNQHIGGGPEVPSSLAIELVVELVRRASFPERPSRLSCAFGFDNLEDARHFKVRYAGPDAPILRVSCQDSFQCDSDLLRVGYNLLGFWLYATKYWSGEAGPSPVWEELLVPPVRVLEKVE